MLLGFMRFHLVYIDLNMVRAGVVSHPAEWEMNGYNEIQSPPKRYGVIDLPGLQNLCGFSTPEQFAEQHKQWVHEAIRTGKNQRENCWTESIAVGSTNFIEEIKARLGIKGLGRRIEVQQDDRCVLREEPAPYNADFDPEKGCLRPENSYYWDV